jgi:hypothetical protein
MALFRGIMIGLPLSIAMWAAIVFIIYRLVH